MDNKDTATITPDSRLLASEGVLFRDLGGEAVLLDVEQGRYYGLDEVGTQLWSSLSRGASIREACESLLEEYEVTLEELLGDAIAFVESLRSRELIHVDQGHSQDSKGRGSETE